MNLLMIRRLFSFLHCFRDRKTNNRTLRLANYQIDSRLEFLGGIACRVSHIQVREQVYVPI